MNTEHMFDVRKWLSLFLLLFITLSLFLPWPAFYRAFLYFGVFPLILWVLFNCRSFPVLKDPVFISSVALIGYSILSSFLSNNLSLDSQLQILRWGISTLFFCTAVVLSTKRWLEKPDFFARLMFSVVLLAALYTIAKYVWLGEFPARITGFGFLGHPILGPSTLISIWAVGFVIFCSGEQERLSDWLVLASSFLVLFCYVFLSQSRGAVVALFVFLVLVFLVSLWSSGNGFAKKPWFFFFFACLLSLSAFLIMWSDLLASMVERGVSYRPTIWLSLLDNPPSSIWFGAGAGAEFSMSSAGTHLREKFGLTIDHPHNIALSTFFYTGLVGVFLLVLVIGLIVYKAQSERSVRLKPVRPFIFCLLILTLLLNATDGHRIVAPPGADWMFFWFPLSFIVGLLWSLNVTLADKKVA